MLANVVSSKQLFQEKSFIGPSGAMDQQCFNRVGVKGGIHIRMHGSARGPNAQALFGEFVDRRPMMGRSSHWFHAGHLAETNLRGSDWRGWEIQLAITK